MPISTRFQTLLSRIQPTTTRKNAKDVHVDQIETCLKTHLKLHSTKGMGSHFRDTAIQPYSDVDLLAVFSRDDARWGGDYMSSGAMLDKTRKALLTRYPNTAVARDKHALVVNFSYGPVDVVPAIFSGMQTVGRCVRPLYWIPDGNDWWMNTAPGIHEAYIEQANEASRYKFKRCIQLLKHWRDSRATSIPVSSFHLELLFASEGTFNQVATYQTCIRDALKVLYSRQCRGIQDPMGVSGIVKACATEAQLVTANASVAYSLEKAERALFMEQNGFAGQAKDYWNMVFNGSFPA